MNSLYSFLVEANENNPKKSLESSELHPEEPRESNQADRFLTRIQRGNKVGLTLGVSELKPRKKESNLSLLSHEDHGKPSMHKLK